MRKIFPILVVLAVVLSCVVPVGAVGVYYGTETKYSAVPFRYFSVSSDFYGAWKMEWPFAACELNTSVIATPRTPLDYDPNSLKEIYTYGYKGTDDIITGHLEYQFFGKATSSGKLVQTMTLQLFNDVVDIASAEQCSLSIYGANFSDNATYFINARVYGSFIIPPSGDSGTDAGRVKFDTTIPINADNFNLGILYTALSKYQDFCTERMFFDELLIDINYTSENPSVHLSWTELVSHMPSTRRNFSSWFNTFEYPEDVKPNDTPPSGSTPNPPNEVTSFSVGEWLAQTVSDFLSFEIFEGFSVDKIVYVSLVIGIMLWFIKLVV